MTSALAVRQHQSSVDVRGPWSLATCRALWQGFTPAALPAHDDPQQLHTVFLCESDWRRVTATVTQYGRLALIQVAGDGDLESAAAQVSRFLSLDVDARAWPDVAARDPVIAHAQAQLPGLRPCGFHSPYEAAAWAVLSQPPADPPGRPPAPGRAGSRSCARAGRAELTSGAAGCRSPGPATRTGGDVRQG
jgi:DNA-3-methyladenine glycosylase II